MAATSSAGLTGSRHLDEAFGAAMGRAERPDPVLPGTGGPAGNARITAWLGLLLLVGFAIEGLTLLSMGRLITWHIAVGALLVPIALAKTATTGWRVVRYYTGHRAYVAAGPPPLVLRVTGPLVVVTTLALLGSGLALIAVGPSGSHRGITILGQGVNAVTLHQVLFFVWLAPMTVHVLGRVIPAVKHSIGRRLPGPAGRMTVVAAVTGLAALAAVLTLSASHPWTQDRHHDRGPVRSGVGAHHSR